MKIGILSMQKILNYGSFLQAFSLKKQFEDRGHDVYFIDIVPGRVICSDVPQKINIRDKFDRYLFKRIENYLLAKKMSKIHVKDYEKFLETEKQLDDGYFDLVVVGSDEVFNATIPSRWGFSTQLFGKIENADRVVTYAASCGSTSYESAKQFGIVDEIQEAMDNFQYISVRDKNTSRFVKEITGKTPWQHLDPVFITDFEEFIPEIKPRKSYLLVYAYGNRIHDEREIAVIKRYAKEHHLDILSVGMQQRWCKHNIAANAFELLAYVKNAACVVTDTFHGTVFSIKYGKNFVTLVRESNKNKLEDLLDKFCLEARKAKSAEEIGSILDKKISIDEVAHIIKSERDRSYEYLDRITLRRENG